MFGMWHQRLTGISRNPLYSMFKTSSYSASENGVFSPISTSSTSNGILGTFLILTRINFRNGMINRTYTTLLDSGREISIISCRCCQQLGLKGASIRIGITWTDGIIKLIRAKRVDLQIIDKLGLDTKLECTLLSKA